MQNLVSLWRALDKFAQKLLHWFPQHRFVRRGIHAVAVKFDEDPIGLALHADARPLPKLQPANTGRICSGQRCIFKSPQTGTRRPVEIEHKRSLEHDRKHARR